jgi:Mg2+-importing ATPase
MPNVPDDYWTAPPFALLDALAGSPSGLTGAEAQRRLVEHGPNLVERRQPDSDWRLLARQLASPLVLLLVFATGVSLFAGGWTEAALVGFIVATSVAIGFWRERGARGALERLANRLVLKTRVLRDGVEQAVAASDVVPGDVVLLNAGSIVPADAVLLEANDFYASEATLTGESFPVAKRVGPVPAGSPLSQRTGCTFMGTSVRSGTATALVVRTGRDTAFGAIAHQLADVRPETEFEHGLKRFGYLLTIAMLAITLCLFAANVLFGRGPADSLLFSLALAVGLAPELLPTILSINLAHAAGAMADRGVLVRRLDAIENLGSMDLLCTDKTGTLTVGAPQLQAAVGPDGKPSAAVLEAGAVNAHLQTGLPSPLDDCLGAASPLPEGTEKLGELPYDFVRKRLSVAVRLHGEQRLITKGAVPQVLAACALAPVERERLAATLAAYADEGLRVIAVADKPLAGDGRWQDEQGLRYLGALLFSDPPKADVADAVAALKAMGVAVKMVTGDTVGVARHIARAVGLRHERALTGADLEHLSDEALWHAVDKTDVFAEVDPHQKDRIIRAFKRRGHVVGYMGDGINDGPSMRSADVAISVEGAADVARESADFVLLDKDLHVLRRGVAEGRTTFANTLKYVLTTTSANLGNMISMAVASLLLPFLPLLPSQVLLNNLLSDVPAMALAGDAVDPETVARPERWDVRFIGRFMLEFGLLSSLFDFATFGALLWLFGADAATFRTGWFFESLLTELLIVFVVRTRRTLWKSRPSRALVLSTAAVIAVAVALPALPFASALGFAPLSPALLLTLTGIALAYIVAAEFTKHWFYRRSPRRRRVLRVVAPS